MKTDGEMNTSLDGLLEGLSNGASDDSTAIVTPKQQARNEPARGRNASSSFVDASVDGDTDDEIEQNFWLTNRDQVAVGVLAVLAFVLLMYRWYDLRYVDRSVPIVQHATEGIGYRIDVNTATWVELMQLELIGEKKSQAIVADRKANGPFSSVDDLQRVHGIGPKIVEKNRKWMQVPGAESRDSEE